MEVMGPRGFGELEVTFGKPDGPNCEIAVAEEFEGKDLALETAAIRCRLSAFDVAMGRGISFHNVLRTLNPNLGIGFIETQEGGAATLPIVDESLRFTGHFGTSHRWSLMAGISEGHEKINFEEPHLLTGLQYSHPEQWTIGVQAGLGREDQQVQVYGSMDYKGLEVAVDVLGQITPEVDTVRTQGYIDYSGTLGGEWVGEPYVRVSSHDTVNGGEHPHKHEIQVGFKLRTPLGFAVFGAYEHIGNGESENGGILGVSYSGTVSNHHLN